MGNRGVIKDMDYDIWSSFDYDTAVKDRDGRLIRGQYKQRPETIDNCLAGLQTLVQRFVQQNGAKGTKRKRALKRFRESVAAKSVMMSAEQAIRLGVPREDLNNIALLLKD